MNTKSYTQQNSVPSVLTGIDPSMNLQRPLPVAAVLRVLEPLIKANDPARHPAFLLYCQWLTERDVPMSLTLAASFWEDFFRQFNREIPRRIQQWAQSINTPGLRSPVSLLLFLARIIDQWSIPGIKHRMCQTPMGKLRYAALSAGTFVLGCAMIIPLALLLGTICLRIGVHVFSALQHAPALLGL